MSELTEKIADFLKVLADQTRLEILNLLKIGERTSKEIEDILRKKHSTISQHLIMLTDMKLIYSERRGNKSYFRIKYNYIFKILNFVKSFVLFSNKEKRSGDKGPRILRIE